MAVRHDKSSPLCLFRGWAGFASCREADERDHESVMGMVPGTRSHRHTLIRQVRSGWGILARLFDREADYAGAAEKPDDQVFVRPLCRRVGSNGACSILRRSNPILEC